MDDNLLRGSVIGGSPRVDTAGARDDNGVELTA